MKAPNPAARLKTALSEGLKPFTEEVKALREAVSKLKNLGDRRVCPLCMAEFDEYRRYNKRRRARCPQCAASERHRISWMYMQRETPLFTQQTRFLHFAPEPQMQRILQIYLSIDYVPASYDPEKPTEGIDIQAIPFEDDSFDMLYCSHVLEHIPDDRLAMRELHRVLKPGGVGVIMVPTKNIEVTYEDASITTPEGREEHFGQWDHLRWYGRDFPERLREAGFDVEIVYYSDRFTPEERRRYGLRPEPLFACRKR